MLHRGVFTNWNIEVLGLRKTICVAIPHCIQQKGEMKDALYSRERELLFPSGLHI